MPENSLLFVCVLFPPHGNDRAVFSSGSFRLLQEGHGMRPGRRLAAAVINLSLLIGGGAALEPRAKAQDEATDAAKRKVRIKIVPEYPELAKQLHLGGKVKVETTISADGHVTAAKAVGGSPLLVNSAIDALKKWRFEPAPRETTEVIEFDFTGQN
jgi:TonB family protein